jgi:hypothetical protein
MRLCIIERVNGLTSIMIREGREEGWNLQIEGNVPIGRIYNRIQQSIVMQCELWRPGQSSILYSIQLNNSNNSWAITLFFFSLSSFTLRDFEKFLEPFQIRIFDSFVDIGSQFFLSLSQQQKKIVCLITILFYSLNFKLGAEIEVFLYGYGRMTVYGWFRTLFFFPPLSILIRFQWMKKYLYEMMYFAVVVVVILIAI